MKLLRISLAVIISVFLMASICPSVWADDPPDGDEDEDAQKVGVAVTLTAYSLPPPRPPVGVGMPAYYLRVDLWGEKFRVRTTSAGEVKADLEVVSADEMVTLYISKGVLAQTEDKQRLRKIEVWPMAEPPPLPDNGYIIGIAYDFSPDGATFDPAIELEMRYDPSQIPDGLDEEDLLIAYYDEDVGKWVECECTCDPETHCITARVYHFTCFAIFGYEVIVPPVIPVIPAEFIVSDLTVSPTEVNIGERVSISLIVANTGGQLGSYKVTLKINGVVEATKEVTVHAGFSKELIFTILKDVAGTYSVDVDGLAGSFRVKEKPVPTPPVVPVVPPPPRVNWAILGPIIGVVVFLAIFLPIRLRKRRRAA